MLAFVAALLCSVGLGIPSPPPSRVIDYTGLLRTVERDRLEATLADGERQTGAQMVVAIFASLEGENLEEFSLRLAKAWGIGRKGVDDGVLLVVFMNDRKIRLEIGRGLESTIPNTVAEDIVQNLIAPRFRGSQYLVGLEAGVRNILYRIEEAQRAGKILR